VFQVGVDEGGKEQVATIARLWPPEERRELGFARSPCHNFGPAEAFLRRVKRWDLCALIVSAPFWEFSMAGFSAGINIRERNLFFRWHRLGVALFSRRRA